MDRVKPFAKFFVAVVGAVVTSALIQFPDNEDVQVWGPVIASLVTAVSVYFVPNRDPAAEHQDESVQPPRA